MQHTNKYNHFVAKVVTTIATSYPVHIIESVSFFSNCQLIATCFCTEKTQNMQVVQLHPHEVLPLMIFSEEHVTRFPTDVQVSGTDAENNPFIITLSFDFLKKITQRNFA